MPDSTQPTGPVELIARRFRRGSAAGEHRDGARLALVIEGGSARGVYSHGMVTGLEELGVLRCFDAVYGASAGALNGAWLLCGRAARARRAWHSDVVRRVISPARALRGGRVVDTRYLVHTVYERVVPMDFAAILGNAVTFHPIGTDIADGGAVDLRPHISDIPTLQRALRASTCMPVLAGRPVAVGDGRYVDAGLSESVPITTARAQGATHIVVLRTRRADEKPSVPSDFERRVVARVLGASGPKVAESWFARAAQFAADEHRMTADPSILQIRPPLGAPTIGRVARDSAVLLRALDLGHAATLAALGGALESAGDVAI
ncbi:patatin-like phospholipase family protein [Nocardia nova]|uniref:patatin-like phospholipase family protein n=1 Tax=Nocardia nova TaxID=37330 RepID=UPI000CE9CC93|nr:patatin-like phospholipase family protein [Nocardia nova]PPJ00683.1 patatin [Nocardia nova]